MQLRRGGAELLLVFGSLLFLALVAALGELAVRLFSDLNFLGNSRNLFVADAYGSSKGNTPNVEAVSFGGVVYTDEHGFRVPKGGLPGDAQKSDAILVLGDSVAFGPAVEEPDTFVGRLRARFPSRRIYNSSVIGYAATDYENVVDAFLPLHPEVSDVVLVFCLNDVSTASAESIDQYLQDAKQGAPKPDLTERLRGFGLISDANDFLRLHSKLYLLLKYQLLASQQRGWEEISRLYADGSEADLDATVRRIGEISAALKEKRVRFVVVLAPFEHQLSHPEDPASSVPQEKLGKRLARMGVPYVDPRPLFGRDRAGSDYFLPYDAMHFSRRGHQVMADAIAPALTH